ncbi:MAG: winged helix-turn-helix domain-containing protein [Calditrichia bacterium]
MKQTPVDRVHTYYVAGWLVDGKSDSLSRESTKIKLEPKVMQVLLYLIERQGEIISRDQLAQWVWADVTVTDHPINRSIYRLRRIFEDDARNARVIETIPKKGYRLICPVWSEEPARGNPGSLSDPQGPQKKDQPQRENTQPMVPKRMPLRFWAAISFCAVVGVGVFFNETFQAPPRLQASGNEIPLTASLGLEHGLAFSPNNQKLLYAHKSPETRQWDLFLKDIDGAAETQLTDTPYMERTACFTPDGKAVTYIESSDAGSRIISLSLMDRVRTELLMEAGKSIVGLEWAPDGKTLAYAMQTSSNAPFALYLFSPLPARKQQLTTPAANIYADRYPVFSPDGKLLIFARLDSRYNDDVYIMSTSDWEVRRLTHENEIIFGLGWSPLTNEIIYCIYDNGVYRLKSVDLNGKSRLLDLAFLNPIGTFPVISPSGQLLSYEQRIMRKNIYKASINQDAGMLENIKPIVISSGAEWNGKVSPDQQYIAFVSDRSGSNELWLCNIDGTGLMRISEGSVPYNCMPSWAPDGRSMVFAVKPGEAYATYRFVPGEAHIELLESDAAAPMHSRDGRWIYFSSTRSGDWRIWKVPASGGTAVQVTQANSFASMESVDGKTLFYSKRGIPGIWEKTGEAREVRVIADLEIYETQNWIVVKDGIYYFKRLKNRMAQLMFYRFADKSIMLLSHAMLSEHQLDDGLSLSPDGAEIYFSLNDHAESDLKMVELGLK